MIFKEENKYKNDFGIYRIKNIIDNKEYIGQTSENFQRRFWHHNFKLKNNSHDNKYLQAAYNKYGDDNFVFEVIEIVKDKNVLDEKEIQYISKSKNSNLSYNMLDGGGGRRGFKMADSTKKLIGDQNRIHMTGRHHSEETKRKMSLQRSGQHYLIYKANSLDENTILKIKQKLVSGEKASKIANDLNVDYKYINNILSNDAWKSIYVDGWEEFQNNRVKQKPPTLETLKSVYNLFKSNIPKKELAEKYHRSTRTITDWIKKYEELSNA